MSDTSKDNDWLDAGMAGIAMVQGLTDLLIERGLLRADDMNNVADRAIATLGTSGKPDLAGPAALIRKLYRRP